MGRARCLSRQIFALLAIMVFSIAGVNVIEPLWNDDVDVATIITSFCFGLVSLAVVLLDRRRRGWETGGW